MKKKQFVVEHGKTSNEWMNFKIYPVFKTKPKTMVTKTRRGGFVTVSSRRTVYAIAFNGERFATSKELFAFKKDYPVESRGVLESIASGSI